MTVSNLKTKTILNGDGNNRVWTYDFDFDSNWSSDDIKIYVTDLLDITTEITTNFTIDKINKTVTYPTIISGLPLLVTGEKITIARKLPLVQTTSFLNQGSFPSKAIEDTSDKPILILQETNERLDRCIIKDIATNNLDIIDIKSMTFIDGSTQLTAGVGSSDNLSNNDNIEITMNVNNTATNPKISFNNYNSEVASIDENGNFIGNSATTTKLKTAVNIAGKSFDGSTSITIASTDLSDTSNVPRIDTTNSFSDTTDSSSSTTGAIKIAGGMGIAKKLFVGTDLNVGGNGNLNTPAFYATSSTGQGLTSGVQLKVAINTEVFDTNECFDSTTNYRFTPTKSGKYVINAAVNLQCDTVPATMGISLHKNGSIVYELLQFSNNLANVPHKRELNMIIEMNGTTDYLELYGIITSTGAQGLITGSSFGAFRLSV